MCQRPDVRSVNEVFSFSRYIRVSGHKAVAVDRQTQTDKLTVNISVMQYLTKALVADIQYICGGKKR